MNQQSNKNSPSNSSSGNVISDSIKSIGETVDNLFTSDKERGDIELSKEKLRYKLNVLQAEITKAEIQSGRGKWRSALGWICTICFGAYYIFQLLFAFYTSISIFVETNKVIPLPVDHVTLWQLIATLLGTAMINPLKKKKVPNVLNS